LVSRIKRHNPSGNRDDSTGMLRLFHRELKCQRLLLLPLAFALPALAQIATNNQAGDFHNRSTAPGNRRAAGDETVSAKVIHGVSYSNLYSGGTLDVRVNACIKDAETGVNGNTSHICDSRAEGGTQTIAAQIVVGDASSDDVTWLLPENCTWNAVSSIGSSHSAIFQYQFTHILGVASNPARCAIIDEAGSRKINALYQNSGSGYYKAEGFALRDTYSGGGPTTSGAVMLIPGGLDTTSYSDIGVASYIAGTAGIVIGKTGSPCCSINFNRIAVGGNYTGGIPVDIEGNGANEAHAVWFFSSSLTHPAPGLPTFKCNDTSTDKASLVGFFGIYEEPNGADTITPINQITGCGSVIFEGIEIENVGGSISKATGISVDSSNLTSLEIAGLTMHHGFARPATAIVNSSTGETIQTDGQGHLTGYHSNTDHGAIFAAPGRSNRIAAGNFAGTCTMSNSTTCTIRLSSAYSGKAGCLVTIQSTAVIAGGCTVSNTTVTITAASANSSTWAALLVGNPD
jgi:hypothetical protein